MPRAGPLVDVPWLLGRLGGSGLRVVDCRFRLGEPGAGERLWLEGHIPGAAFLDVDRDLASEPGERGRHPLPEPRRFEAAARRAGIGPNVTVVAYDEAGEGGAARLWWLLRHFGHDAVVVLDGGLRAWRAADGPLDTGGEQPPEGSFAAGSGDLEASGLDELARAEGALVLDGRAPERYRGEVEPIDAVAGHIPGALNLPFAEVAPEGRFLAPAELRARFEAAGAEPDRELVAYCGSGITACVLVLAAELAGIGPARLYPGSWSEWSRRGYPAARHDSARSTDSLSSGPGGLRSA
jgi:thiosulfate/3-mercaptopyruvate sulfurtransferase